jgi:putative transposase
MIQQFLVRDWGLSIRKSCRLAGISRNHLNAPYRLKEEELRAEIRRLSFKFSRFGYRRIHTMLEKQGWIVNLKRVRRIRREEGLQVKKRRRKRKKSGGVTFMVPEQAKAPNHVWTVDFMLDRLNRGSSIRLLTVVDEFTRESLCIRVERSLKAEDVRLTLEALFKDYGTPAYLRSDNGSEFVARCLQDWLAEQGTRPLFIDPGCPWQNGKCESFNGRFREECLDMEWFDSLKEAQLVVEAWREHYNTERPHSSLGYLTPVEFIQHWQKNQEALRLAA